MSENAGGWTEVKVTSKIEDFDSVCAVMSMLDAGLYIQDYSDLDALMLDGVYGDLIDDEVKAADKTHASASIYVPDEKPLPEYLSFLRERLSDLRIDAEIETVGISEEDWAENWKQYYHPIRVGRVTIVPAWEKYEPEADEVTVLMDPGMAFGTGTHETTRLVISLMQKYSDAGRDELAARRMLDLGCGSGILAITASKLGYGQCFAYDIDPVAVRVTAENIKDNGTDNVVCGVSNLTADVDRAGRYSLITANIVADIIIRMAPDIGGLLTPDGVLIVSGIITERREDVLGELSKHGLCEVETAYENGWCAMALRLS